MKNIVKTGALMMCALGVSPAMMAQSTIFSDNFANGSTINGASAPGGTPTASSTSYDFDSIKTGAESISAGNLNMSLTAASTGGEVEAEALFTSTPVTLVSTGDYINLTYTFTDTGSLLAGGTASQIYSGLYNSGGTAPATGTVGAGNSGNAVSLTGANNPTGNAQGWIGYVSRIAASGGASESYTRPSETSTTGTSTAQDLVGNKDFTGGYGKTSPAVAGTAIGANLTSTVSLTAGNQYTVDYQLTLQASGQVSISDVLFSGVGTGGSQLSSQTTTTSASTLLTTTFDGMAIGIYNSGTSMDPAMDINQITITDNIAAVPEPDSVALLGGGMVLLQIAWRRLQKRA